MSIDAASAITLSVAVASVSTLVGLVPAVLVGRWLSVHRGPAKALVSAVVLVPLVLPPVITGLLLLDLLGRHGPIGAALASLGLQVTLTRLGAVIAALVVGFPLYVLAVRQAFESVDPAYLEVAATLGDPPRRAFVRVALPLAAPGIAGGAVLAFARALGEFGATIVVAGNTEGRTRTIALAVYSLLDVPGRHPELMTLISASLILALAALAAYEVLSRCQRRRLELGD